MKLNPSSFLLIIYIITPPSIACSSLLLTHLSFPPSSTKTSKVSINFKLKPYSFQTKPSQILKIANPNLN